MKYFSIFIKTIVSGLAFSILLTNNLLAQPDTLSLLHITDLHLIFNQELYQQDLAKSREHYAHGIDPLKQFLQSIPEKTNSKMVIATGDLLDSYETEAKNGEMVNFQADQFIKTFKKSKIPVFLTLGNHDITSYSWENNTRLSNQNHAGQSRAKWIKNFACFKNGTYYSQTQQVGETMYRFIFLDNAYNRFSPEENITIPYLDKAQLHWLESQLKESDNDIEVIMMHIPLIKNNSKDKPECELFSLLEKYSSVKLVLAGHNHKNAITPFDTTEDHKLIQVQTGAFAQDGNNWRKICFTGKSIYISVSGAMENELIIPIK